MIKKIDHIGIAVKSIDDVLRLYTETLGLSLADIEVVEKQRVKTAIILVGDSKIELLESTDPEGPVAKHIARRGEGLHHLALEVDNVQETIDGLVRKGVELVDKKPRNGVEGSSIAFLHPRATRALIELVQSSE